MRGQVGVESPKNPHALIGQGVNKIDETCKQKGDTEEQNIIIGCQVTGIPGDHEEREGNDDGKTFRDNMKENIAVEASQIKPRTQQSPQGV